MGWQAVPSAYDLSASGQRTNFGQTVNGNYGFGDMNYIPDPDGGTVDDPNDKSTGTKRRVSGPAHQWPIRRRSRTATTTSSRSTSRRCPTASRSYQATKEEDVNVFDGDVALPQENFPASSSSPTPVAQSTNGAGGPVSQRQRIRLRVRRRTAHRARDRPGLPGRRRQPLRGPGRSRSATQARHGPGRSVGRAELQPVHPGAAPDALLGPDDQRPGPVPGQDADRVRRGAAAAGYARWASTTGPAAWSTP